MMMMYSLKQFLAGKKSIHDIIGEGIAADVILWRRKDMTVGIAGGALVSWVIFQLSGYTLLSFVSTVAALLLSILFAWAKTAQLLGRPPPPLPQLHLPKETINGMVTLLGSYLNQILSAFQDISRGKNPGLFYKLVAVLSLTSKICSWTDLFTACYIGLAFLLTVPVIYERYERQMDGCVMFAYQTIQLADDILCALRARVSRLINLEFHSDKTCILN